MKYQPVPVGGIVALVGGLAACGDVRSFPEDDVASRSAAVLNGAVSGREDDGVVMVVATTARVTYRCTGTLVAHNLVLTARHCVSDFDDLAFACTNDGELVANSQGGRIRSLYPASQVSVHAGDGPKPAFAAGATQLFAVETASICRNDIALILLDRELSELPIMPIRLRRGTQPGEVLRVVGYGADEAGFTGNRKTLSGPVVAEVGPSEFRSPGDDVPPRTFVTQGPSLCTGDSGGPGLVSDTVVAGVWSQVVGACTASSARNYFTEVAPFAEGLVLPAFEAAGADPWYEGTPGPGAANTGGADGGGDTSTAGDGSLETGGAVGSGGNENSGGQSESGGAPSSGGPGASGGAAATGGSGGSGGGLRKKGGCTCSVAGAPSGWAQGLLVVPLAALAWWRRRRGHQKPV